MAEKGHLFNIKLLSEKADIDYNRLYRSFNGGYATIKPEEVERIKAVVNEETKRYLKILELVSK